MKTKLRPHKVLGRSTAAGELHALSFTTGDFAGIVFSYTTVNFEENEEQDHLKIAFEYNVHYVPEDKMDFDTEVFEKELGDFVVELLMYGLEKEHLGFIDGNENRENNSIESDSQRGVLP
jgi:hypothetical protein